MPSSSILPRALFVVAVLCGGASEVGAQIFYNSATGHGYTLTPPLNFADARAAAAAMGGHLVSIGDAAEQTFIKNTFMPPFFPVSLWIGLSDEVTEGTFLWDDGAPLSYTAWLPGAPSALGAGQDAVMIAQVPFSSLGAVGWDDDLASNLRQGVVELPSRPGDTCDTAVQVFADGAYFYDSTGPAGAIAPSSPCSNSGGPDPYAFWFEYVAPANGSLVVSNCPASTLAPGGSAGVVNDTYIAVWAGGVCPPSVLVVCDEQSPDCSIYETEVVVPVVAGASYYVQIGAWGQPGAVTGSAAFKLYPADLCTPATELALGVNGPFDNSAATDTNVHYVVCEFTARDVWFTYVSPTDAYVTITTARPANMAAGTLADPNLVVYAGCGGPALACADGFPYDELTATVYAAAGQPLLVRVAGWFGQTGTFFLTVTAEDRILRMSAPAGAGSLLIENLGGDPFGGYFTALTLNAGAFPNGYFGGIDPTLTELVLQLTSGSAPFVGPLDAAGRSAFGPVAGLPPLTLYGVTLFLTSSGLPLGASPPITFSIP